MKGKLVRFGGLLSLLILMLALAACSAAKPAATAQPPAGTAVAGAATGSAPQAVKSGSSVMAEGKAVPVKDATLSFSTSGVVGDVLVKNGDMVQAGQPLLRLKGGEKLTASVSQAELELLNAQQALTDLKTNADLDRSKAQQDLAAAQREMKKANDRLNSKEYRRGSQEQVDVARADYILAKKAAEDAEEAYNWVKENGDENPTTAGALSALAAARQRRDKALYNLNYLMGKPDPLDIAEIDAQVAVAQAKVADAQRRVDALANGPDPEKLAAAEARVKNATVSLDAAKAALKDLELSAPFAGQVTSVDISAGEFTQPGSAVLTLADFSTWMVNTTDLTELSVARVKVGQPALVRFDAIPGIDFIARVTEIKTFGENRQGDVVYTVVLKMEKGDERLRWNMTASVTFLEKENQ